MPLFIPGHPVSPFETIVSRDSNTVSYGYSVDTSSTHGYPLEESKTMDLKLSLKGGENTVGGIGYHFDSRLKGLPAFVTIDNTDNEVVKQLLRGAVLERNLGPQLARLTRYVLEHRSYDPISCQISPREQKAARRRLFLNFVESRAPDEVDDDR